MLHVIYTILVLFFFLYVLINQIYIYVIFTNYILYMYVCAYACIYIYKVLSFTYMAALAYL